MRLLVTAPRGKMGKALIAEAYEDPRFVVASAVGPKGRDYIGRDVGLVAGLGLEIGAPVLDGLDAAMADADVIIDFSTRELSLAMARAAVRHTRALVCGTTGFSEAERAELQAAAAHIPLLPAANTSRLVNFMNKILVMAAATFGNEADIEIIEMHDRHKLDAPSGTSREMGALMAGAMGKDITDLVEYGRHGTGGRAPGAIGYHSIRAGNITSDHTVIFGLMGERLEITHHSYGWECFVRGALDAAAFLYGKPAGLYSMKDVVA